MGREIKFRAWTGNVMLPVDELHFMDGGTKWYGPGVGSGWITEKPIMQFTGLRDKNYNEIYEGDLLLFDGMNPLRLREIRWHQNGWYCFFDGEPLYRLHPSEANNASIEGNIYEHPYLHDSSTDPISAPSNSLKSQVDKS